MGRVTISLDNQEIAAFRDIAEAEGKHLATVIVEHLQPANMRPTTAQFYAAAASVHQNYKGWLSKDQAVEITAVALRSLHEATRSC